MQYLVLALAHEKHFLLSQRMGQQRRDLILHGSLVREREARPPKSAEIFLSLAPGIAGLHFIQCSLVFISWLQEEHEGMSLNGHSPAGRLAACATQGSCRLNKRLLQLANTELPVVLLLPVIALSILLPFTIFTYIPLFFIIFFYI